MRNSYKRRNANVPLSSGSSFISSLADTLSQGLDERTKSNYQQIENRQKSYQNFELQNLRGRASAQRQEVQREFNAQQQEKNREQRERFHQEKLKFSKVKFPIPPKEEKAIMRSGGKALLGDPSLGHTPESAFKLAQALAETYGWKEIELVPEKKGGFLGIGAQSRNVAFVPPKGYSEKPSLTMAEPEGDQ